MPVIRFDGDLPKTKQYFQSFNHCPDCRRIYWRGSHYDDMIARLKADETVKSSKKDDFVKCSRYGLRILRNAAYSQYAAMMKDDA